LPSLTSRGHLLIKTPIKEKNTRVGTERGRKSRRKERRERMQTEEKEEEILCVGGRGKGDSRPRRDTF